MPRIRTIKPEFWSSPSMRGADPWVRLLFIAMWNWADDFGRGTANYRELAAFAFPDDQDPLAPTVAELPLLLAEVQRRWAVAFYEVGGRRYYAIPSWDEHQKNERRAKSRYPAPGDGVPFDPSPPDLPEHHPTNGSSGASASRHGSTAPPRGTSGTGTGEQGNRGSTAPTERGALPAPAIFDAEEVDEPPAVSARTIVGEWIERCAKRPPKNVIGQISKHVKSMLDEGIDPDDIRRGLAEWMTKDVHPSVLPSVVDRVMNRTPSVAHASPNQTDQRVAALMQPMLEQVKNPFPNLRALPGGA
jgi:hypothetical protein